MKRSKKVTILVGLAVLLTAGVAVAAWLVNGTGPGAAKTATATNLTVTAGTAAGDLYPNFAGGDVFVHVQNDNNFPVQLTDATIAGPISPSDCAITVNTGPFSLSGTTAIPANSGADVTIPDALSMGANPASTCQGADIAVGAVTVHGASAAQ